MAVDMKSFQISNIIYDANTRELTFKFNANGFDFNRVSLGVITDDDIIADFKKILNKYYTVESE